LADKFANIGNLLILDIKIAYFTNPLMNTRKKLKKDNITAFLGYPNFAKLTTQW
jgi:hypothetical protein